MKLNGVLDLRDKNVLGATVHYASLTAISLFIPYYYYIGNWPMFVFDSLTVLILALISLLFIGHHYLLGKTASTLAIMIFLSVLSLKVLDYGTNTHLFFFLLMVASLTIFDYGVAMERFLALGFAFVNGILVVATEFYRFESALTMSEKEIHNLSIGNTLVFALLLLVIFYLYNVTIFRYQKALENHAETDGLTGILNRRTMIERGEGLLSDQGKELAVIMFDIDHFKGINDGYGHQVGDRILREICLLVSNEIRQEDVFGRYGGEEFMLIVSGTVERAEHLAERIRKKVEDQSFDMGEAGNIHITISLGVSVLMEEKATLETLIGLADEALYRAKACGRNQSIIKSY